MYPWFALDINALYVSFLGFCVSFYYRNYYKALFYKTIRLYVVVLGMLYLWVALHSSFFGVLNFFFCFYIISSLILTKEDFKIELFRFITKWFSLFLLVSAIFFILFYIGVPLPHTSLYFPSLHYYFDNYYFFVVQDYETIHRFRSVFGEPGHLTQGLILLLVGNQLNLKDKYVLFLFIAQILTFSLAGYICLFVAYSLFSIIRKNSFKTIIFSVSILTGIIYMFVSLSENSYLYNIIGYRFSPEYAETRNARTTEYTDLIFSNFSHSLSFLWGLDNKKLEMIDGSGYKVYLMNYGLIGGLLTVLFYWLYTRTSKCKLCLVLFIICMLEQYQGASSLWFCVLIGYILSINNLNKLNNYK